MLHSPLEEGEVVGAARGRQSDRIVASFGEGVEDSPLAASTRPNHHVRLTPEEPPAARGEIGMKSIVSIQTPEPRVLLHNAVSLFVIGFLTPFARAFLRIISRRRLLCGCRCGGCDSGVHAGFVRGGGEALFVGITVDMILGATKMHDRSFILTFVIPFTISFFIWVNAIGFTTAVWDHQASPCAVIITW